MRKAMIDIWMLIAAMGVAGCTEAKPVASPLVGDHPALELTGGSFANDYACSISGSPSSASMYVGDTISIEALETYCKIDNGIYTGITDGGKINLPSPVYWSSGNTSLAVITNPGFTDEAYVAGVDTGTVSISLTDCTNPNLTCPNLSVDVPVTIHLHSLAGVIDGDTYVNTGNDCSFYMSVSGGYAPYSSYSWSVDGTIVSGQGTANVTVTFDADGSHLVSAQARDSHSNLVTAATYVTSVTNDPPELTCSAE